MRLFLSTDDDPALSAMEDESQQFLPEVTETPWEEAAAVDLEAISAKYPDVIAWIIFENEDISYPVLHTFPL